MVFSKLIKNGLDLKGVNMQMKILLVQILWQLQVTKTIKTEMNFMKPDFYSFQDIILWK